MTFTDKIIYKDVKFNVSGYYYPAEGSDQAEYDVYSITVHDSFIDIAHLIDCKEFQDALIKQIEDHAEEMNNQLGME
jgi:hypothetical protein